MPKYAIHLSNTSIERIFENHKNGMDQFLTQIEALTSIDAPKDYLSTLSANETGGLFLDVRNPDWYL